MANGDVVVAFIMANGAMLWGLSWLMGLCCGVYHNPYCKQHGCSCINLVVLVYIFLECVRIFTNFFLQHVSFSQSVISQQQ